MRVRGAEPILRARRGRGAGSRRSSTSTPTSSSRPTSGRRGSRPSTATSARASSTTRPARPKLSGTSYIEEPGTEGPDVAWWFYEDQLISVKRTIAAAGYPADEIELKSVSRSTTCARAAGSRRPAWPTWTSTASRRSSASRTTRASAGRSSSGPRTRSSAWLCVEAYNDWMVDEWCGSSGGRLIPLSPHPAVGRRARGRRGAPQRGPRRARGRVQRAADLPRPAEHLHRLLGPVLRGLRGDRHGHRHAHRLGHEDAEDVARRARRGAGHHHLRQQRRRPDRLPVLGRAAPLPRTSSCSTPRPRSAGSPTCSSGPTTCGRPTAGGATRSCTAPSRRRPTTTGQVYSCFFKDAVGVEMLDLRRRGQHRVRDRLPAPGRHLARQPPGRGRAVRAPRPDRSSTRSPAATPSASSASISDPSSTARHTNIQRGTSRCRTTPATADARRSAPGPRHGRSRSGWRSRCWPRRAAALSGGGGGSTSDTIGDEGTPVDGGSLILAAAERGHGLEPARQPVGPAGQLRRLVGARTAGHHRRRPRRRAVAGHRRGRPNDTFDQWTIALRDRRDVPERRARSTPTAVKLNIDDATTAAAVEPGGQGPHHRRHGRRRPHRRRST